MNTPSFAAAKIVHIFAYLGGKLQTKDDKIYLLSQEDVDPNGPQTPIRSRRLEQPLQLAATTDKYREFGDATEEFENDAGSYQ